MGYFVEIRPKGRAEDPRPTCPPGQGSESPASRCEFVDEAGRACANLTALPAAQTRRYCYFHHPDTAAIVGEYPAFDAMMRNIERAPTRHDEEAALYLHYSFGYLEEIQPRLDTIIEAGAVHGGFSALFAQVARQFGLMYYLVDHDFDQVLYAGERIATLLPDCLNHVRLYCGSLVEFAKQYARTLKRKSIYLEIDGTREYSRIVADLASAHAFRYGIHSIGFHDFNQRYATGARESRCDQAVMGAFGLAMRLRQTYGGSYIVNLAENGFCFDNLPLRAPLRNLVRAVLQQGRAWVMRKVSEKRFRKNAPPLYAPQTACGLEIRLPARGRFVAPDRVQIGPGETVDLAADGRVFVQFDKDRGRRELDPAAVQTAAREPDVIETTGMRIKGLQPGRTELQIRYGGFECALDVAVSENGAKSAAGAAPVVEWPSPEPASAAIADPIVRNRRRLAEHLRNGDVVLESGPCRLEIAATTFCNLRCTMCPGAGNQKDMERSYDQVLDDVGPFLDGVEEVALTASGEPMIWKDYDRAAADMSRRGKVLRVVTNATLVHRHLETFARDNYLIIHVSLDATGKLYEEIRRGAKWENVSRNIRMLGEILAKRDPKPMVGFNMTVGTHNYQDIPNLVAFAEEARMDIVGLSRLFLGPLVDRKPSVDLFRSDKLEHCRSILKQLAGKTRMHVVCLWDHSLSIPPSVPQPRFIPNPAHWDMPELRGLHCMYPFTSASCWLGNAYSPCCMLLRESHYLEGSLRNYWNSPYLQHMRRKSYDKALVPGPCGEEICYVARPFMQPGHSPDLPL
jgi:wyosine [tRNA(Phe)-imidazoG37] synthetase (radical SAM superfamily)